jgi:hypothetical protein
MKAYIGDGIPKASNSHIGISWSSYHSMNWVSFKK